MKKSFWITTINEEKLDDIPGKGRPRTPYIKQEM